MPNDTSPSPVPDSERPRTSSRIASLVVGPAYLGLVAAGYAEVTDWPFLFALPLVLLGATIIAATLVVFGVKAYHYRDRRRRFTLSTALLVIVPLSIYLAGLRSFFSAVAAHAAPSARSGPVLPTVFAIYGFVFIVLSTVVLIWMTEAVMWLAVVWKNARTRRRQDFRR